VLAFQALYRHDMTGQSVAELLDTSWMEAEARGPAKDEAREFAALLVQGTVESLAEVDGRISEHLEHWDLSRLRRVDLAILRVSVYALLHQPSIPAGVTIDEAVDIAKEFGGESSYRFVNGVLDAVRKGRDKALAAGPAVDGQA
jgi:transcription antitermination protein NusB